MLQLWQWSWWPECWSTLHGGCGSGAADQDVGAPFLADEVELLTKMLEHPILQLWPWSWWPGCWRTTLGGLQWLQEFGGLQWLHGRLGCSGSRGLDCTGSRRAWIAVAPEAWMAMAQEAWIAVAFL